MAGLKDTIKYAFRSLTGNLVNTARAGWNHLSWGTVGSILAGGIVGGLLGNLAGAVVGGVLGSTAKYYLG